MKRNLWVVLVSLAMFTVGCSRMGSRPDAQVASDVQNKIVADSNVPDKQVTINANNGVVTLSGNVSSDAARNAAAGDAAQVPGVKTVVNNLQVTPAAANVQQPQEQADNNPPPPARDERRPSPRRRERAQTSNSRSSNSASSNSSNNGDNGLRTTVPSSASNGSNSDLAQSTAPPAPTPTPKVTLPSGTQLSIRLNDEVDSEKAQVGDVFHGSISSPVSVGDQTIIPTTADVEGRVV